MNTITSADKGKRYSVDGNKNKEVTLFDVMGDDFVKVICPDGSHESIASKRLQEVPTLERVVDEVLLDYPQKAVKVTIEVFDAESGKTTVKWLEGDDALLWNTWMRELCYRAEELGVNPYWLKLGWRTRTKRSSTP